MLKPNPPGFHTTLSQEKIEAIVAAIPEVMIQTYVARAVGVLPCRLTEWLQFGERDQGLGKDTIFAQLSTRYHLRRTEVVRDLLTKVQADPKNYQAYAWVLAKCFREEFGADSHEIRELKALFEQILPTMGKGVPHNGKQMDTESNQTPGRVTEGTTRQEGGDNTCQETNEGNPL